MTALVENKSEFFDLNVEADVLSALLLNNQNIDKIIDVVKYNHFYSNVHQKIFQTMQTLINKGQIADITNVVYYIKIDDEKLNLKEYLTNLLSRSIEFIPIKERASIVADLYIKRSISSMAGDIKDHINSENSVELLEKIENSVFAVRQEFYGASNALVRMGQEMLNIINVTDEIRKGDAIVGIPTGFNALDNVINGFHKSDLIILAARPSMGKTALALNLAYNIASHVHNNNAKGGVAFFSLEMSSEQIVTRALSMISGVNSVAIRTGRYPDKYLPEGGKERMSDEDFDKLVEVSSFLQDLPLFIDDTPAISPASLKTKARMLKQVYGISAIFIDYLQLMRSSEYAGSNNRVLEISDISQSLKAIAKELDIPVIALSQLSRQVEARDDKRPMLSDLRESGAIEQDADIVMFIYREEYYLEKSQPKEPSDPADINAKDTKEYNAWVEKMYGRPIKSNDGGFVADQNGNLKLSGGAKNLAEVIVAKHRNGPVGSAKLFFDKERTHFYDLAN